MAIVFDREIPPLQQRPDVDATEIDVYCLAPVYGAPGAVVAETRSGQSYQLFRRCASIPRTGVYQGFDLGEHRKKIAIELCSDLKNSRAYADYAIGMPDEFIYRESNGKVVKLPQSMYLQLSTE